MSDMFTEDTESQEQPRRSTEFNKKYDPITPDPFDIKQPADCPKTYCISGWHKPDNETAAKIVRKCVNVLTERGYTMRVPYGDLDDIIHAESITTETPLELYKPWKKYEGKKDISGGCTVHSDIPEKAYSFAASLDPSFNSYKQSRKSFVASTIWALYGPDLLTPARVLVLHTWGREKSPSDITTDTNAGISILIKAASAYNIPIYNLNDKASRQSFSDWLESN